MRRRKARNWTAGILAAALLAASTLGYLKTDAAEAVDMSKKGSVTISLQTDDESEIGSDTLRTPVTVKLYQVAEIDKRGYYSYTALFDDETAPKLDEFRSTAKDWDEVIKYAAEKVENGDIIYTKSTGIGSGDEKSGYKMASDGGKETINELELGMYLMLVEDVYSQAGDKKYTFSPSMFSVPDNLYLHLTEEQREDSQNTVKDEWRYQVDAYLKPESVPLYGDLVIKKTLTGYQESLGEATCVFEVVAQKDTNDDGAVEVVYTDVISATFTNGNEQTVTIHGLPAGATVTVKEVYASPSYQLAKNVENPQTVVIKANEDGSEGTPEAVSVSFSNEYDKKLIGGHSVTNYYKNDEGGFVQVNMSSDTQEYEVQTKSETVE